MEELKKSVDKLVAEELERANKKFPMFHSTHEGYAIIKEEMEEMETEVSELKIRLEYLWRDVRKNLKGLGNVEVMYQAALLVAAEAIQVAAMCIKYKDSFKVE